MQQSDGPIEPESPRRERDTIVVEDEVVREGFTQVPNLLLKRSDLSHGAKIAYALLLSYAWQQDRCFPGQDTLASDMGVERKAVIRYLQELRTKGVIRVQRRGMGKTNVYFLPRLSDVPAVGHKEYSSKNTQSEEEFLSNFERPSHQFAEARDAGETSTRSARSNGGSPSDGFTTAGDIMQQRAGGTHRIPTAERRTALAATALGGGTRTGRAAYGGTEEREKLYAYLRDFCPELGDEAQLASSITQVLKIFHAARIPVEHWDDYLYRARTLTLEHSASITKRSSDANRLSGKNKFPYFKTVLGNLVSPSDRG